MREFGLIEKVISEHPDHKNDSKFEYLKSHY